jgi:hypothetical protein
MSDFLVKRDDLRECRIAESAPAAVGPGEALLRIDRFGLTANNVTYAVMGEVMSYWDFFPAEDGWGRVPMWGFAEVEQSEAEGVKVGARVYGYLPPSSHLLVTPASVNERGFTDGSPHRAALPSAYHRFLVSSGDPFYRADTEDVQMLLRPLFYTSFLIDDQLDDEGLTARGPIVISSASSKTALAAAFLLARREGIELVGLTSARNKAFVSGLGIYGRTVSYDELARRRPRHLRRHRWRRRRASGGPHALRRQARAQHDRGSHPLGGSRLWPGRPTRPGPSLLLRPQPGREALHRLGPSRARAPRGRGLAPLLRVDSRLAGDDPRPGLRGPPERLPGRARGPRRPEERPRHPTGSPHLTQPRLLRCALCGPETYKAHRKVHAVRSMRAMRLMTAAGSSLTWLHVTRAVR